MKIKSVPLVSVVMPVYNMELYLDAAIESILNQTFSDFEFIIINDGSTDKSLKKIKKWAEKDSRIKVYDQLNKGRALSRNKGIEIATTEFIAMMDSDDIALPERLFLSYNLLKKRNDVVAVSGQFQRVCMYGVPLNGKKIMPLEHDEIESRLLQSDGSVFHQSASIFRKNIAIEVGGYDASYKLGEDTDFFLKLAIKGKLINLPDLLLYYREHHAAITKQVADPELIKTCKLRMVKALEARGKTLNDDFVHWLEKIENRTKSQDMFKWGWNALIRGHKKIARKYAIELVKLEPMNKETWRFVYCAIRGR